MKRALQAQGITTPAVIDASQLNHTILNGGLKSLAEATTQQAQVETIQTNTGHQHHQLMHTKQEPGTANNSPKVSMVLCSFIFFLFISSFFFVTLPLINVLYPLIKIRVSLMKSFMVTVKLVSR